MYGTRDPSDRSKWLLTDETSKAGTGNLFGSFSGMSPGSENQLKKSSGQEVSSTDGEKVNGRDGPKRLRQQDEIWFINGQNKTVPGQKKRALKAGGVKSNRKDKSTN